MRYLFKQAVNILKKDYHRGQHEVPEAVEYHPTFLKYVELGLIEEVHASKVISPETLQERQQKLHETLVARRDGNKKAAHAGSKHHASDVADDKSSEKKSESVDHDHEKKAKSKK